MVTLVDKTLKKDRNALSLTQREALAAVLVAATASDGVIDQKELYRLVGSLVEKSMFRTSGDLGTVLKRASEHVQRHGATAVIDVAVKAIEESLRPTAYALAADLVLANSMVESKERSFLDELQRKLGIDDATALKIVEVVAIKNRG